MNIQTERIENHRSRLTVVLDSKQLEDAKLQAARELSKEVNVPGFRKGKVPYRILANFVGEAHILEAAIEELGNKIYKDVIEQSGIQPYGPGAIEDVKITPEPTLIFTVPLMPEIKLNDYRSVRLDFQEPSVTDADVDKAMRDILMSEAVVEESQRPAAMGNRLTVDLHTEFTDGPDREEMTDEQIAESAIPLKGDSFVHQHDAQINLLKDEDEPILPGFVDALIGTSAGDEHEFELEVPAGEQYEEIVGRKVHFHVTVNKVENVTLPELNDDFAARVTANEAEPLTLLQFRIRVRENLEARSKAQAEVNYAENIINQIMQQAEIHYPNEVIEDQIDDFLNDFEQNVLRRQNLTLKEYIRLIHGTMEDLRENYRPLAINQIRRSLTVGELMRVEQIRISEEQVTSRIEANIQSIAKGDEQIASLRRLYERPEFQENLLNELLSEQLLMRMLQIGKGEAPELSEAVDETPATEAPVTDEASMSKATSTTESGVESSESTSVDVES